MHRTAEREPERRDLVGRVLSLTDPAEATWFQSMRDTNGHYIGLSRSAHSKPASVFLTSIISPAVAGSSLCDPNL
jgi:hypothetical protein